jgi:hypothetical protein
VDSTKEAFGISRVVKGDEETVKGEPETATAQAGSRWTLCPIAQLALCGSTVTLVSLTAVIVAGPAAVGFEITTSFTRKPSVWQPAMVRVVVVLREVRMTLLAPTATAFVGVTVTPRKDVVTPDTDAVQVIPSDEVRMTPALPTAVNWLLLNATLSRYWVVPLVATVQVVPLVE